MATSQPNKCSAWLKRNVLCLCYWRKSRRQVQSIAITANAANNSSIREADLPKITFKQGSTGPSNRYDTWEEQQGSHLLAAQSSLNQLPGVPLAYKTTIVPSAPTSLMPKPSDQLESQGEKHSFLDSDGDYSKRLSITFSESSIHSGDDSENIEGKFVLRSQRVLREATEREPIETEKVRDDPWELAPRSHQLATLIHPRRAVPASVSSESLGIKLSRIDFEGESGNSDRELFREMAEGLEKPEPEPLPQAWE